MLLFLQMDGIGQRMAKYGTATGDALRRSLAVLLLFAFGMLTHLAPVHQHCLPDLHTVQIASAPAENSCAEDREGADPVADCTETAVLQSADCGFCDFAATAVTPAVTVSAPVILPYLAETPSAQRPIRTSPYQPFRFCDRSASRAPPVAA